MFEEVLRNKKHFLIIGSGETKVVIGTDSIEEVSQQRWFQICLERNLVSGNQSSEDELTRLAKEQEQKFNEENQRMQQEEEQRRAEEQRRQAEKQRIEEERRQIEEQKRRHEEQARQQQAQQQPQQQPQQQNVQGQQQMPHPPSPPKNLEFPFMDVTPDKMTPDIWSRMSPEQQQQWQKKYGIQ